MDHITTTHIELPLTFEVEIEPYVEARLSDLPERCYPESGGTANIYSAKLPLADPEIPRAPLYRSDLVELLGESSVTEIETSLYDDWLDSKEEY